MKKLFPALLFLLLFTGMAHAQSTTVSGTVTDGGGQTWANGTFQFTFVPNTSYPSGPYTWTGGTLPTNISGVLNSVGGYSVSIPSNTAISPIGTSWVLQVCPQATWPCFTTTNIAITGGTQTLNVAPPVILIDLTNPPSSPIRAYSDAEIGSALVGSYYYQLPIQNYRYCQTVTGQLCTLWNTFGGGAPPTGFPRLDQVLNPNVDKTFNLGTTTNSYTNGALDFSGLTSPIKLPLIAGCTPTALGQICVDSTGLNFIGYNGGVSTFALFPQTVTDGDVVGFSVSAGQYTQQDLGPVNTLTGQSFLNLNMTTPIDGDIPCFDSTGPPYWNNCTAGTVATVISGATSTYTFALTDNQTIIEHDKNASASVTGTLPTADTLGFPAMGFIYSNHSTHADSLAPTTWTVNGSATLAVAANTFCRVYVDTHSSTNWLGDCATTGGGSGTLSGTLTAGKVPVASAPTVLVDGSILDDGTHAARDNAGYDVNSLGAYIYWVANAASTGTTVNKMVCDDGAGKGVICNHTTSTTNDPLGVAVVANGATPGTTGSTGVCNIGFCTVVMDNGATANHYAQQSTSVDGDLSDVGTTQPTNGQPYWHIFSSNAGAGTTAVFRNMDSSELNATSGGGGKSTSVQVNGTGTKNIANLVNGTGITFAAVNSGNTTTITPTVTVSGGVTSLTGDATLINNSASTGAVTLTRPVQNPNLTYVGPISSSVSNLVQSNIGSCVSTSCTTLTVAFPSANTAGDLLVLSVLSSDGTATLGDTGLNSYTQATSVLGSGRRSRLYYVCSAAAGANSVTFASGASTGTASAIILQIFEFSGNATSTCADQINTNTQANGTSSMTVTSGGSVTQPTELVFTAFSAYNDSTNPSYTITPDSLSTQVGGSAGFPDPNGDGWAQTSAILNTTTGLSGAQTMSATYSPLIGGNGGQRALMVTFKLNSTGSAIPSFRRLVCQDLPTANPCMIFTSDNAGKTAAIADTTMVTSVVSQVFRFSGSINCTTTSAAAVATLNLKYTDTANVAQTVSISDTCTALITTGIPSIVTTIRAKAGTAITAGVMIANTPTYDTSWRLEQM